jgi:hypothetical protein
VTAFSAACDNGTETSCLSAAETAALEVEAVAALTETQTLGAETRAAALAIDAAVLDVTATTNLTTEIRESVLQTMSYCLEDALEEGGDNATNAAIVDLRDELFNQTELSVGESVVTDSSAIGMSVSMVGDDEPSSSALDGYEAEIPVGALQPVTQVRMTLWRRVWRGDAAGLASGEVEVERVSPRL